MCGVSKALAVAGAATGAIGSIQAGNAKASAASYQAAILEKNRQTALDNAAKTQAAADQDENALRRKNAQFAGTQIASAAGGNIDLSSGSIADIFADTARLGEEDALTLRQNWDAKVSDQYQQARDFSSQAALTRAEGKQAKRAGYINAASSLLAGATSISSKWSPMMKTKSAAGGIAGGGWTESMGA